ncbi:MAG: LPP20 family lipoprotein [Sulfurifustis sp.]
MKLLITTIAWVVLAVAGGCATSARAPDWVGGAAAKYPSAQYLVGRGEGPSGEEARDRARADLAKIFDVDIAVESEDTQAFRTAASGSGYEARSARRITTRTEQLIEGIEIADTWHDPKTGSHYALAVLPRAKAGTSLRREIERLDEATRLYLDRARDSTDLLAKIAAASQAVVAQTDRVVYQKQLRVIDPTGVGAPPSMSLDRLGTDRDALLKRVKVAPHVTTDASGGLAPVLKGALSNAGFLADTGASPDYVLEASLALDDLGLQDGWYWQRGVLEVRLLEPATQRVRGLKRWPIKASALQHDGSVQRAVDASDKILKKELRGTFIGFAAGVGTE